MPLFASRRTRPFNRAEKRPVGASLYEIVILAWRRPVFVVWGIWPTACGLSSRQPGLRWHRPTHADCRGPRIDGVSAAVGQLARAAGPARGRADGEDRCQASAVSGTAVRRAESPTKSISMFTTIRAFSSNASGLKTNCKIFKPCGSGCAAARPRPSSRRFPSACFWISLGRRRFAAAKCCSWPVRTTTKCWPATAASDLTL